MSNIRAGIVPENKGENMRKKTALALSAGGMFGAYQAGVWKSLQSRFRPDVIVGASIGALNGWCIAGGCSGEELARMWLDPATASLLQPRHAAPLALKAAALHASYRPRAAFGLCVVELPWLSTHLIRNGEVRAEHLLATCSVPGFLPSVRIAGKRFTDGGLLDAMPLWAAAEMGATRIVAVNAMPGASPFWMRAGIGIVRGLRRRKALPGGLEIVRISPSEPMGTLREALTWDADAIRRRIELGERDGDAARLW